MSSSASGDPAGSDARRRGRRMVLLLLGVALLPVVAATLAYLFWKPGGHVNYGDLIPPRPIEIRGATLDGEPFALSQLKGRWVLLHLGGGRCDEACVKRHFAMRQVRLMQNRNMERIERLWLIADAEKPGEEVDRKLVEAYTGMHVARAPREVLELFPGPDPVGHVYVVDPLGNLMLRFPGDPDPKGMHRDLGRLLRASRAG